MKDIAQVIQDMEKNEYDDNEELVIYVQDGHYFESVLSDDIPKVKKMKGISTGYIIDKD